MRVVALTGNIASGKSTVAELLRARGATVIDADVLAREAVAAGTPGLKAIRARWGAAVLNADGTLDRAAMRAKVFSDASERAALEAIVHPEVERLRQVAVERARDHGASVVVCDIPLLFEKGMAGRFARLLLVDAPEDVRRARLVGLRGVAEDEARAMMASQLPSDAKRSYPGVIVIENAGSIADLEDAVDRAWEAVTAS